VSSCDCSTGTGRVVVATVFSSINDPELGLPVLAMDLDLQLSAIRIRGRFKDDKVHFERIALPRYANTGIETMSDGHMIVT
jgi:hypothetical protein